MLHDSYPDFHLSKCAGPLLLPFPISLQRDSSYIYGVMSVSCPIPFEPPISAESPSGIQHHCQCIERAGFDSRCSATPRTCF